MKKLLVLVVAVLALAGLATMAYADTTIFADSWGGNPLSMWMGSNQASYLATPSLHAITESVVFLPLPSTHGQVAQITYTKAKESWSGRSCKAGGGDTGTISLSGSTKVGWDIKRGDAMTANVEIDKFTMKDSNGNELTLSSTTLATATWATYSSPTGLLDGKNLSAVNTIFSFFITNSNATNSGNPAADLIFYLDNVKYVGGGSGMVQVTLTSGVVGVQVEQIVNFDLLGSIVTNTSYNSASITDATQSHFIVTNKGTDPANFSLNLVNPGGWTAVQPAVGPSTATLTLTDTYALWALFSATTETPTALTSYGVEDVLSITPQDSSATRFAYTTTNGAGVIKDAKRHLWIALHTPPMTSVGSTQQIIIVVTAKKA